MIHQPNRPSNPNKRILRGLVWLSSVSLLSGGAVFAQEASDVPAEVPAAQELLQLEQPAPDPVRVAPPEPAPAPAAPRPAQPERVERSAPESVNLQEVTENARRAAAQNEQFIDASPDFNLGATQQGDRPAVMFSERSTGCKAVLQPGQNVPAQLCGGSRAAGIAQGDQGISGDVRFSRSAMARGMASPRSVNVGPIRLSANGISLPLNAYNPLPQSLGVSGNGNVRLTYPLAIAAPITSAFGWRIHPISGALRFHYGVDLGAPTGTPVVAAFSGRVKTADFLRGYGLTVILQHEHNAKETLYAHLSEMAVRPGEWVEQGQAIGRVGSTGNSTGPHLHFEVRKQTNEGWVVLNAGDMLQASLGQITEFVQLAQLNPRPADRLISFNFEGVKQVLEPFRDMTPVVKLENPIAPVESWIPEISETAKDWDKSDLKLNKQEKSTKLNLSQLKLDKADKKGSAQK